MKMNLKERNRVACGLRQCENRSLQSDFCGYRSTELRSQNGEVTEVLLGMYS